MEAGLKFFSRNEVTEKDFEFADFVEVLPVPGNVTGVFTNYKKKYRVHCAHDAFGFNPSDIKKRELNKSIMKDAVTAADQLGADRIVVHAGFNTAALKIKEPKKEAIKFLKEHFDERICIENLLPVDNDMVWVGYGHEDIAEFKDLGFKFCLDFGHAVATATHFKKDYKEYISEFIRLKPHYFHLSGALNGEDKHLSIFDSDTDIDFFRQAIKKAGKPVCLETPLDSQVRKKEIEWLKQA